MSTREPPIPEQLGTVRQRLSAEVVRGGHDAPAPFVEAWQLALDEAIDSLLEAESRGREPVRQRACAARHLQALARELAYEMALFGERREAEEIGDLLAAIVADELTEPAIAA